MTEMGMVKELRRVEIRGELVSVVKEKFGLGTWTDATER